MSSSKSIMVSMMPLVAVVKTSFNYSRVIIKRFGESVASMVKFPVPALLETPMSIRPRMLALGLTSFEARRPNSAQPL